MLKSLAASTVGVALAGCSGGDDAADDGDGTDGEDAAAAGATFTASLSDDGSIPGHEDSDSDGTGGTSLEETDEGLSFEVSYENLEGAVNGVHIHGDGAADGGYLVRFFEPEGSEHADEAVLSGGLLAADGDTISGTVTDDHVNPSGDYDGEIETVSALVSELEDAELGSSGGVVNIHTEHAPDSELAGQVEP